MNTRELAHKHEAIIKEIELTKELLNTQELSNYEREYLEKDILANEKNLRSLDLIKHSVGDLWNANVDLISPNEFKEVEYQGRKYLISNKPKEEKQERVGRQHYSFEYDDYEYLSELDFITQIGVFWEKTLDFKEYIESTVNTDGAKGKAYSFYNIATTELEKAAMSFKLAYEFQSPDREER